jgi:hypothetical protein
VFYPNHGSTFSNLRFHVLLLLIVEVFNITFKFHVLLFFYYLQEHLCTTLLMTFSVAILYIFEML